MTSGRAAKSGCYGYKREKTISYSGKKDHGEEIRTRDFCNAEKG